MSKVVPLRYSPDELARVKDEAAWEAAKREAVLDRTRDVLLMLVRATGLALADGDLARIETCEETATLDRWIARVPGAKSVADILA